MKTLRRTQFGNPVLREKTRRLSREDILSPKVQELITNMRYTLENKKYGVGLAATQVGQSVAITVIGIKPTPTRPDNPIINMVVINPEIVKTYDDKEPMWEGCVSFGDTRNFPYALVPRYKKIRLRWLDERAETHEEDFEDILAHVLQHETDHLNGILFVDKVEDTKSYITISEYKKRYLQK
ncbi:MAG: peptide deformylase [Candidatus Saccharibacteria bacterium]